MLLFGWLVGWLVGWLFFLIIFILLGVAVAMHQFIYCAVQAYRDYGHDVDNTDTLIEAGLGFTADLEKPGGAQSCLLSNFTCPPNLTYPCCLARRLELPRMPSEGGLYYSNCGL